MTSGAADNFNIDDILRTTIKALFNKYSPANNPLTKDEFHRLLFETLTVLGGKEENGQDYKYFFQNEFPTHEFDTVFQQLDKDDSGTVTEEELLEFVKEIAHL